MRPGCKPSKVELPPPTSVFTSHWKHASSIAGKGARFNVTAMVRQTLWGAFVLLAFVLLASPTSAASQPSRIVSLSVCTDQLVLALADKSRIRGLSFLAVDPLNSAAATQAVGVPLVHASAEEVLRLDADLVVIDAYSSPAMVAILRQLGRTVLRVPYVTQFGELDAAITSVAEAVGESARGQDLIAGIAARLESVANARGGVRPTALVYQVNGFAAGKGSLADAVLTAAGFRNLAGEMGLAGDGAMPLETLLQSPPDLIILDTAPNQYRSVVADNLRHPALRKLMERVASLRIAAPLWLCAGPRTIEAVEQLAAVRQRLGANGSRSLSAKPQEPRK